jgi:hypothetical protein
MSAAFAQQVQAGEFWIPVKLKWQMVPGDPTGKERMARADVFYFAKDGRFVRDNCWLIKNGKVITISNGDPHEEYVGDTTPLLDGMHLKYRLVRRTVERQNEILPGKTISEDASTLAYSGLSIGKRFFRRVEFANADDYAAAYQALLSQEF